MIAVDEGTAGCFSSGWPVAYLIAAVIVGVGALIGSFTYLSHYDEFATRALPAPGEHRSDAQPESVGRITGMIHCTWAGESLSSSETNTVSAGRRFELDSGLLEITYHTGAKVILQGPVTYEADSKNGGRLALGKLTGKVESSTAKGFVIRTPTAIITDLGTEFGVEVNRSGNTSTHVYRGNVELRALSSDGSATNAVRVLHANESARVEKGPAGDPAAAIVDAVVASDRFVRTLPVQRTVKNLRVLAHFRLGEDDPNAMTGATVAEASADHGRADVLKQVGLLHYAANADVPGSRLAVDFGAGNDGYLVSHNGSYPVSGNFILEAWVRLNRAALRTQIVVFDGAPACNGCGLLAMNGTWKFGYGGIIFPDSKVPCQPGVWTHLALVCEYGKT